MKALRGTPKHLSRTGQLNSFTYLMLNLPFECNYRCLKCFNLEESCPTLLSTAPVTVNEMRTLIQDAKELDGKAVVLAGEGEPSLSRNIRTIVSEINSRDMIPIIYSNGSLLTGDLIRFYKDNNASLVIQFDSLVPEIYDRLTGTRGRLSRVVKNTQDTIHFYKDTIESVNGLKLVRVAINATISSPNESEVPSIKDFFGDDVYFICNPLARSGNAVGNWNELIESDESHQRQCQRAAELSESGGPLTLGGDGICGYSRWGIAVSPSGDYMTCAYTKRTNGLLGNIRGKSLKEAFECKYQAESDHHAKYGAAVCLVRAPHFELYVRDLIDRKVI